MTIEISPDKSYKIRKSDPLRIVKAVEYFKYKGLISPGKIIEKVHVEQALGIKYEPNSWKFLGPFLLLKTRIESEGYFITQRDLEAPAFRILSSEEMAEYAHKKLMNNMASNFKIAYTLAAHDTSNMEESSKKKHKTVQAQASQTALLQQKMLLDTSFF